MRILVTGGAGFIGSHITARLCLDDRVKKVIVLDNLAFRQPRKCVKAFKGRFRSWRYSQQRSLCKSNAGHQRCNSLGPQTSVQASFEDPLTDYSINCLGTRSLMLSAREHGVPRVILASTAAVYGDQTTIPIIEQSSLKPQSPYGKSKLKAEQCLEQLFQDGGPEYTILRIFNVYGRRTETLCQVEVFALERDNCMPKRNTDGGQRIRHQTRDFIHIDDVVEAFWRCSLQLKDSSTDRVFNVGSGTETNVLDLVRQIEAVSGCIKLRFSHGSNAGVMRSAADLTKEQRSP